MVADPRQKRRTFVAAHAGLTSDTKAALLEIRLTPWTSPAPPTEPQLRALMQSEGLAPYSWSNGPHDVYAAHSHTYDKVIYCISGSITFGLPGTDRRFTLHPGDRLDLPAGTLHDALVGSEGVVCLEAHF